MATYTMISGRMELAKNGKIVQESTFLIFFFFIPLVHSKKYILKMLILDFLASLKLHYFRILAYCIVAVAVIFMILQIPKAEGKTSHI